jgi:hypothetical protein
VLVTGIPPVAGAALLGLDHVGAGPEAEQRLRAACTAPGALTGTEMDEG